MRCDREGAVEPLDGTRASPAVSILCCRLARRSMHAQGLAQALSTGVCACGWAGVSGRPYDGDSTCTLAASLGCVARA
jgi:hypothetical protein